MSFVEEEAFWRKITFLDIMTLSWPLTPSWSWDICGTRHWSYWPSLVKIE